MPKTAKLDPEKVTAILMERYGLTQTQAEFVCDMYPLCCRLNEVPSTAHTAVAFIYGFMGGMEFEKRDTPKTNN